VAEPSVLFLSVKIPPADFRTNYKAHDADVNCETITFAQDEEVR